MEPIMLPNDVLFLELAFAGACFVAGAWVSGAYHAHRAYRLRLVYLRARMAEWAVAA
jgi:hypothetical protein